MFPKISCIIPVYNAEKYLHRCLDTVCNQTYSNLEIILVDDGSSDNSGSLCDVYAAKYRNIKTCHISNSGATLARKIGLDMSTSEYVTFVDSDDYICKDYILILYENMIKYKVQISACAVKRVKIGDKGVNIENESDEQLLSFDKIMSRFFKYEFWGLCGKLYDKAVFNDVYFPKATLSEDYVIMMQLFTKERTMAYTDSPLYCYEYHENSLSHQKLSERAFEEFENVKYVYDYTLSHCPEYAEYALSNVLETSVKLYFMKNEDKNHVFQLFFQEIRRFLFEHKIQILRSRVLVKNVKLLAIGFIIFPAFTIEFYNRLINR